MPPRSPQSPGLQSPQYGCPPPSPPRAPPPLTYAPEAMPSSASHVPPPPRHDPQVSGLNGASGAPFMYNDRRYQDFGMSLPPGQWDNRFSGYGNVFGTRPDQLSGFQQD